MICKHITSCLVLVLTLLAMPAAALQLEGQLIQGGLVQGQVPAGTELQLDGERVPVADDGRFLLGFDRNAAATQSLAIMTPDGRRTTRTLTIEQRDYDIQRIDGLPDKQVTPPEAVLERIRRESEAMQNARDRIEKTADLYTSIDFGWPLSGRISGVYGSQRILNGEPKRPHYGLDIAAASGTPIRAPAAGVVAFTHPGMYFNGSTVLLNHGLGLSSVYIHLSDIAVDTGDWVDQGQVIGRVGETGRTTGPHLHWGIEWRGRAIDPRLLLGSMPES